MRLIDADALPFNVDFRPYRMKYVPYRCIEDAPTIDAEPVKHGRWEYLYDGNYKCSECGAWWTCEGTPIESGMMFCPSCGAKMDGGDGDAVSVED